MRLTERFYVGQRLVLPISGPECQEATVVYVGWRKVSLVTRGQIVRLAGKDIHPMGETW